MIKHIAFTMYPVTDMARARRFYADTLGSNTITRTGTFALTDLKEGGAPSVEAGGSIAFEVQNVDEMVE